jgi:hypothetical protein
MRSLQNSTQNKGDEIIALILFMPLEYSANKKTPVHTGALSWLIKLFFKLRGLGHVGCLEALRSLYDLERNLVALVQRLEAVSCNGRKVHEYVLAIVLRDKAEPLAIVEPLHYTVSHSCFSSASV